MIDLITRYLWLNSTSSPSPLPGVDRGQGKVDEDYRPALKKAGLMTRDPREKERRKYGLKKARKASQYSKR